MDNYDEVVELVVEAIQRGMIRELGPKMAEVFRIVDPKVSVSDDGWTCRFLLDMVDDSSRPTKMVARGEFFHHYQTGKLMATMVSWK